MDYNIGDIVKTKNKIIVYRIGILLYCIYILTIAFLKEKILDHYILLGFYYGIVQGFFWSAGHTLVNETAGEERISKKFVSIKSIIGKICNIIFPVLFGASIELTSFFYIAKIIIPIYIYIPHFPTLRISQIKLIYKTKQKKRKEFLLFFFFAFASDSCFIFFLTEFK